MTGADWPRYDVDQMTSIDTLPDDVLLAIFSFYLNDYYGAETREKMWRSLVHMCQRWRSLVFGSPRHLNLELVCTERTRARDTLDVWPAFPLIIMCVNEFSYNYPPGSMDHIIAVLERSDRVCRIDLTIVRSSDLKILLPAMQEPFIELTQLQLRLNDEIDETVVIPDSFLGGSAPRLEDLCLIGIPFPGLPKLLLSASQLADLHLEDIPHSGYFSPDAMVAALSTLTGLEKLFLRFHSPRSCPDPASRRPPPSTRSVLPALTYFRFRGVSEYLEDLVACIDAPQLIYPDITFFNDTVFDTPQFIQFISRTPTSRAFKKAHIVFRDRVAKVKISSHASGYGRLKVKISCRGLDWQVSCLEQVCTSCLPSLQVFMLEDLYIYDDELPPPDWKDNIENRLWLELLRPFTAAKNLYLSEDFAPRIGRALQELVQVEGGATEVLPTLQVIFLEKLEPSGSVPEGIRQFVAARQAASHPIAVSRWDNSENEKDYFF